MKGFSAHLFWDTDPDLLSLETHRVWIVKRVLEKGAWDDWLHLLRLLGKKQVGEAVREIRCLEKRALRFACASLSLDENQLKCYLQQQSQRSHWIY